MISLTESFLRALGTRGLKLFIRATNKKVKFLPLLSAGQPLLNKLLNLYKKKHIYVMHSLVLHTGTVSCIWPKTQIHMNTNKGCVQMQCCSAKVNAM